MSPRDSFDGIVASLHEAAFNASRWPAASTLIDKGSGSRGNGLFIGEEVEDRLEIHSSSFHSYGRRCQSLERAYVDLFHNDADVWPRVRGLSKDRLTHASEIFTNAAPRWNIIRNGLLVCFDGPEDSHVLWAIGGEQGDWKSDQTGLIERLVPHVRHFVCVRQALTSQADLNCTLTEWLDSAEVGVIHLGSRGRVVWVSPRGRDLLQCEGGLQVCDGILGACLPAENTRLKELLQRVLQAEDKRPANSWMTISRSSGLPRLVLCVRPVGECQPGFDIRRAVALVLDPGSRVRIDAKLLAEELGFTTREGQVAALLAEGRTVREIAFSMGIKVSTVRWHVKGMFKKLAIVRQCDLIRLVLSLPAGLRADR